MKLKAYKNLIPAIIKTKPTLKTTPPTPTPHTTYFSTITPRTSITLLRTYSRTASTTTYLFTTTLKNSQRLSYRAETIRALIRNKYIKKTDNPAITIHI